MTAVAVALTAPLLWIPTLASPAVDPRPRRPCGSPPSSPPRCGSPPSPPLSDPKALSDPKPTSRQVEMMLEGGSWVDFNDGRTT